LVLKRNFLTAKSSNDAFGIKYVKEKNEINFKSKLEICKFHLILINYKSPLWGFRDL